MAKQLNVNLAFTADTSKAKAQLQDLQNQLSQVINMPSSTFGGNMAGNIKEATRAAAELKVHLQNATNVKTGSLDFTKLNQSIKNSGSSLSEYAAKLQSIGPEGQKAFTLLAQSVASAEVPIRRSNALLSELWVTMKNTARWQLTSSMLHGFMGAVQSAVGYTEDLNESLNNIRIVTGNSVEQMADFAKEANKAAKALSTSTTNYTNAALIYYQQGLDKEQVLERADITTKMANVSRQSAEEVSDQMTAIWNNFYDGSQSLEHYADAMTRLGADTASSSDEIAQGLEKFAAIGDMIGLSFDNAAAALATVTATTRQSADVVGTAFKTIFARIQGLSLGETLDDGTNLNKYSEALNKVGISIFEQNGELKDMDNILDEMGAKWKTLSKDQQVALAQTVAGVRQYNQLVALMDNYDFYEQNLTSAKNADGSLQAQADIYAESWEAASERVGAALEGLYDSLINDEAFIDLLNGIEKVISGVEVMVDSIGGFGGVITALGVIFTKVFSKQISESLTNASYGLMSWTEAGRQKIQQEKMDQVSLMLDNSKVQGTEREILEAQLMSYQKLTESARDLTDFEKQTWQILLDQQKVRGQLALQKEKELKDAKAQETEMRTNLKYALGAYGKEGENEGQKQAFAAYEALLAKTKQAQLKFDNATSDEERDAAYGELSGLRSRLNFLKNEGEGSQYFKGFEKDLEAYEAQILKTIKKEHEFTEALKDAKEEISIQSDETKKNTEAQAKNNEEKEKGAEASKKAEAAEQKETAEVQENTEEKKENVEASKEMAKQEDATGQKVDETKQDIEEQTEALKKNEEQKKKLNTSQMAQNFVAGANAAMSAASAIQSISSAMDTLQSDATPIEKITSVFMSLTMAASMGENSLKDLDKIVLSNGKSLGQAAASTGLATKVLGKFGVTAQAAGSATAGSAIALGSLALYAGIAIAAIVAVTAIVKESIDTWNDDKLAVEGARLAVEQATKAFDEAKTSLDNLRSSLKEYQTLQDAFNGLTEGTKEWNEALEASNAHVSEMLRAYPELAQYFENDNGKFSFTDTQAIEKVFAERVRTANTTLNTSQIALNLAENRSLKTNALRDSENQNAFYRDLKYMQPNGSINTTAAQADLSKSLDDLQKAYNESGSIIFTSQEEFANVLVGVSDKTIEALWDNKESLEKLAVETNLNTAQMRALIESNVAARNEGENYYDNLDEYDKSLADIVIADRAAKALADTKSDEYQKARQEASDEIFGNGFLTSDNYDAYLKARFGEDANNYRVKNAAGDDATLQKKNEDGTWENVGEKNSLSNTEVLDYMTAYKLQGITSEDENTIAKLQEVENAIRSSRYNDKNQLDDYDEDNSKILQLQKDLVTDGTASLLNFSPREVEQIKASLNSIPEEYRAAMEAAVAQYSPEAYANNVILQEKSKIQDTFATAAAELDMSEEVFESYAASLMEADGNLKEFGEITGETATETAELRAEHAKLMKAYADASVAQYKLAKGLNKVQDAYKDNQEVLEEGNEASLDFHEAIGSLTEALSEAFGMEIDASFVKDNLSRIKEMANGSEDALIELRKELNKDYIMNLNLETENAHQDLIDELNRMSEEALNADIGTEITMDNGNAIAALNEALFTGQATIQDIEAMFNNANLAMPEYKTTTVKGEAVHTETDTEFTGPFGIKWKTHSDATTYSDRVIPYFGDTAPSIDDAGSVSYGGGGKISTTTTGDTNQLDQILDYEGNDSSGGKNSKAEKKAITAQEEVVERYKEISDTLEDINHNLSIQEKLTSTLTGNQKIAALEKERDLLIEQSKALEEKKKQAEEYLAIDQQALVNAAAEHGITGLTFDADGDWTNYTDIMTNLYNQLADAQRQMNELATKDAQESFEESTVKPIQDAIDALSTAIGTYDATKTEYQGIIEELLDNAIAEQEKFFEAFNEEITLQVDIQVRNQEQLDKYLEAIGDTFFDRAENLIKIIDTYTGNYGQDTYNFEQGNYNQLIHDYTTIDPETGHTYINQTQFVEGMDELRGRLYDNIDALKEYDELMTNALPEAVEEGTDRIDRFSEEMKHSEEILDHYVNLAGILGKKKDFKMMGDFLTGQASIINDQIDVAKAEYESLIDMKEDIGNKLMSLSPDDESYDYWAKQWDAVAKAANNAQDEILSLTEDWANKMREVIENSMAQAAENLEKALLGGGTFDELMTNLERANERQEEWLTKTNQLYETNKLINTANRAIDSTTNKAAKTRLKNFADETQALQDKNQLSKYELEIQQAKYDLLLAEIALEEAQNAKATVRLSRDSEGNFGYVYTADQDTIADAEQELADKENDLYNLALDGANKYAEKRAQALQELNDKLADLNQQYLDGEIETQEEYEQKRAELVDHYTNPENGILTQYSYLYNVATTTHSKASADAWNDDYLDMTKTAEDYKNDILAYYQEIDGSIDLWEDVATIANKNVGDALNNSEKATKELTDKSEKLKDLLVDDLIPALDDEYTEIYETVTAYAAKRLEVQGLISDYYELAKAAAEAATQAQLQAAAEQELQEVQNQAPAPTVTPNNNNNNNGDNGTGNGGNKTETNDNKNNNNSNQRGYLREEIKNAENYLKTLEGRYDTVKSSKAPAGEKKAELRNIEDEIKKQEAYIRELENKLASLNTGGYTGAWGPEGRLALLHEKELVLNKDDTSNFLTGIQILREIARVIDLNASHQSLGFGNISSGYVNTTDNRLQQEITIQAEFPNATDRYEIEEAFNNLVNRASQYANRK